MCALALARERRGKHRVAACAQQCGDTRVAPAAAPCAVHEDEGGGMWIVSPSCERSVKRAFAMPRIRVMSGAHYA